MSTPSAKSTSTVLATVPPISAVDYMSNRWEEFVLSFFSLGGKDKAFRSFAYLFQFISGVLESKYPATSPQARFGASLRMIEGQLSTFRQGIRVLGIVQQYRSALADLRKASTNPNSQTLVNAAKTASMVPYYVLDNLTWLAKIDAITGDKVELNRRTISWWFTYLVLGVLSDTVALQRLMARTRALQDQLAACDAKDQTDLKAQLAAAQADAVQLGLSYIKNAGDLVLATSQLWYNFSRPVTGLSGAISSFIGWYFVWPKYP